MAIVLSDTDLDNLLAFYKDPSYKNLAMFNSVIKPREEFNAADFHTENRLFTDMVLTLKGQNEEKRTTEKELINDFESQAQAILEDVARKIFN